MDLLIEKTTDKATAGDQQHRYHGSRAVYRAEGEIAVVQDRQWPDDAQYHVDTKPVAKLPEKLEEAVAFAQRIQQQCEYEQAANNAECVTEPVLRKQAT